MSFSSSALVKYIPLLEKYSPALLAGSLAGVTVFTSLVLANRYMRGGKYRGGERLDGKLVVITGANSGLGKVTAQELLRRGGHVVMACRDLAQARAARDEILAMTKGEKIGTVRVMQLDLASFDSIRKFHEKIRFMFESIDILINNAGVFSPTRQQTHDGLELTLGVGHIGHFLLTNLLLPKLEAAEQGRVIFVSSKAHALCPGISFDDIMFMIRPYTGTGAYQQCKLANILLTSELARRLNGTKVTVNCLHPGVVMTNLLRDVKFPRSRLGRTFFPLWNTMCMKTPLDGVQTTLRLALDPGLSKVTGKYFSDCVETRPSAAAQDRKMAKRLLFLSEYITKTKLVVRTEMNMSGDEIDENYPSDVENYTDVEGGDNTKTKQDSTSNCNKDSGKVMSEMELRCSAANDQTAHELNNVMCHRASSHRVAV